MAAFGKSLQQGPDHKGETTYIMYHGTTMKAAQRIKRRGFIRSVDGMLGPGVYVSRSFAKAACYPRGAKGQKCAVLKLAVRVGRVKAIDRQGHHLQKSWHQAGYDTAWVPPNCGMVKSGRQENCVWDPKRIKVLSIQSNERESSDDESTHKSTDEERDRGDDDDEEEEEEEEEDETTGGSSSESADEERSGTEGDSDEGSRDFSDERSSRRSSDTSTDEYVNTDDTSPQHVSGDRHSRHSDNHDEASDEEGSNCDESNSVFAETGASQSSREFSDEYSDDSDDDY